MKKILLTTLVLILCILTFSEIKYDSDTDNLKLKSMSDFSIEYLSGLRMKLSENLFVSAGINSIIGPSFPYLYKFGGFYGKAGYLSNNFDGYFMAKYYMEGNVQGKVYTSFKNTTQFLTQRIDTSVWFPLVPFQLKDYQLNTQLVWLIADNIGISGKLNATTDFNSVYLKGYIEPSLRMNDFYLFGALGGGFSNLNSSSLSTTLRINNPINDNRYLFGRATAFYSAVGDFVFGPEIFAEMEYYFNNNYKLSIGGGIGLSFNEMLFISAGYAMKPDGTDGKFYVEFYPRMQPINLKPENLKEESKKNEEETKIDPKNIIIDIPELEILFQPNEEGISFSDNIESKIEEGNIYLVGKDLYGEAKIIISNTKQLDKILIKSDNLKIDSVNMKLDSLYVNSKKLQFNGNLSVTTLGLNADILNFKGKIDAKEMELTGTNISCVIKINNLETGYINGAICNGLIDFITPWNGVRTLSVEGQGGNLQIKKPQGNQGKLNLNQKGNIKILQY